MATVNILSPQGTRVWPGGFQLTPVPPAQRRAWHTQRPVTVYRVRERIHIPYELFMCTFACLLTKWDPYCTRLYSSFFTLYYPETYIKYYNLTCFFIRYNVPSNIILYLIIFLCRWNHILLHNTGLKQIFPTYSKCIFSYDFFSYDFNISFL